MNVVQNTNATNAFCQMHNKEPNTILVLNPSFSVYCIQL